MPDDSIESVGRGRRLRSHASAHRRRCPDRWRRSGVYDAAAGGDIFPRVPARRVRHLRVVAIELHAEDRRWRLPLCRRTGVPLAGVPAHRDRDPHRPGDRCARRPEGAADRVAGVSTHRLRVGAGDPLGRLRRRAEGHHLGAGRHRGAGPPREDRDHAAARRADRGGASGAIALGDARCRNHRRHHRAARFTGLAAPTQPIGNCRKP